ncbi:MAG: hypothetical protein K6G52_03305, partial [Treponemataceae bacterium]|nr:hypothetical protein [Treponemataceae bacterium]
MKNGDLKDVRAGELAEKSELVAGEQADLSTVYFYRNPATNKFEISESPKTYVPVKKGDENHPEIENQDFSSDKIYLNYYDVSEFKNK